MFFPRYSWGDIQVPWDPLDEDGNEEEFEDTVSLSLTQNAYSNCDMMNRFSIEHRLRPRTLNSFSVANGVLIPGPALYFLPASSLFDAIKFLFDPISFQLSSDFSFPLRPHHL